MSQLESRNVQAIVSGETHRVLRDVAYEKKVPLKELICDVLNGFVTETKKEAQLKRTLSVP